MSNVEFSTRYHQELPIVQTNFAPVARSGRRNLLLLYMSLCLQPAHAQSATADALKFIENPGGGQAVYGTIDNQHTPQSAMAFMLKTVHGHYGDRPQVSKVFQVRNSNSYAAFFTLVAKTEGNKSVAGEVIVSMPQGGQPVAAVLTEDAQHFATSQPVLLRKLNAAWHASVPATSQDAAPAVTAATQPLHRVTAGDRSVYISVPDGWKVLSVAGGSVTALGPRGERLGLNLMVQGIHDPRVRNQFAGFRSPNGAAPIVYPYGGDLFTAYTHIVNQARRNQRLPPATFHLNQTVPLGGGAIEAHFDVDLNDGFGERVATARINEIGGGGTYAMGVSGSSLPKTVAAAEGATLMAVIRSASQDASVVRAEQGAVMGGIRAAGVRSKIEAQEADQRRVASAQAFDASMDNIDRQSKAMQNYTFDRSQIQDNDRNGRATVSNGLADALIQTDPTRYQIVPPSQFLKGVDY